MDSNAAGYGEYLRNKGYAAGSIEKYKKSAVEINNYMFTERGIGRMQDVRKEDIKAYENKIYTDKRKKDARVLSMSTRSGKIVGIKNYFKYLARSGKIMYNPAEDIEVPFRSGEKVREVLKVKEMERLIGAIKVGRGRLWIRDRAIIEVLYSTGIRNTELRELELRDIDLETEEIRIRKGKGYFGSRERVLPLGRIAVGYVGEYIEVVRPVLVKDRDINHLFVSWRGRKLGISAPNALVKRYAKKAGIKKEVCAHMLRHSCATHLLKGGADIRYVQEMLGHRSLDSTKVYTKVEISDLKKVHRKSHPRERV